MLLNASSLSLPTEAFSKLPAEIIDHVLSFLSPKDLNAIATTCRRLSEHGKKDLAWYRHVQDSVPGCLVKSPSPCATYRELYVAHDPYWFLPKYKVWFCDYFLTGKLIIVRYDPRRGCIEGYRLVAERKITEFEPWEFDDEVIIHSFEPKVLLHRDLPVLQLDIPKSRNSPEPRTGTPESGFTFEIPMHIHDVSRRGTFANLLLARAVEERPNMALWPPQTIPARHRVRNASQGNFVATGHRPQKRSDISDQTFRIRRWMQMVGGHNQPGVRLAEEVYTYSTLDPHLYTPTSDKPYRGIWVGDYAGHGCEFLLIHQPGDEVPFDESSVIQRDDESMDEFLIRKREERIYRGRIEAIKLTGDPNVPRGEYTFIADDIGKDGFVRVAHEAKFKGARIVKSKGHVAERLFRNGTSTYLIVLISQGQC
jgi:hypothetical protein